MKELKNIEIGLFVYNIEKYKQTLQELTQDEEIMKSTLNQEEGKLEKTEVIINDIENTNQVETNIVTKVLEIKYLTKEEYIEWMEAAYTYELSEIKAYEERNKKYNQNAEPVFNYSMYIDELIYGHAKEEK